MNSYFSFVNISTDQILKQSKDIKLLGKALESYNKGKEFIDKQMELENDTLRNEVGIVLTAYLIEKMSMQKNQ